MISSVMRVPGIYYRQAKMQNVRTGIEVTGDVEENISRNKREWRSIVGCESERIPEHVQVHRAKSLK